MTRRLGLLVACLAIAPVAVACGGDDGSVEVVAGPASTAAGQPCRIGPEPSGPLIDDAGGVVQSLGRERATESQSGRDFDWDGDGTPDRLGFDGDDSTVTVDWGDGQIVVRDVASDFTGHPGNPVLPGGQPFLEQPDMEGAPSAEATAEGTAAPTPAVAADVTGDSRPDLIMVVDGTVSVLVGDGSDDRSRTIEVAEVGGAEPGWRNPPVVPTPPPGFAGTEQVAVPYAQASVVPVVDFDGDGVTDVRIDSVLPRARGPVAYYTGKPCG